MCKFPAEKFFRLYKTAAEARVMSEAEVKRLYEAGPQYEVVPRCRDHAPGEYGRLATETDENEYWIYQVMGS
jgi:hypothetical protein